MVETLVIIIALIAGLAVRLVGLPPMIGFLAAGFMLPYYDSFTGLDFSTLGNLGVTLLLFTIGLKLNLRSLIKPQIWAVTSLHMGISVGIFIALFSALKIVGWSLVSELSTMQLATIGFALSFSSTVFAVKVLEDRGEVNSLHGTLAIGILIMQDIFAVLYLTLTGDKSPAFYSPLVLLIIFIRPLFNRFLMLCGHGELLTLAGFSLAFGGAALFQLVDLKGDLGALFIGAVIAGQSKSSELAKALLSFKDFLLIGFFLSIGQAGLPDVDAWLMAALLMVVLALKPVLYYLLMTRFYLRARPALGAAMVLNNYSEFGLIVMAIATQTNIIPKEWAVIIALVLSLSYILSSLMITRSDQIYSRIKSLLYKFQTEKEYPAAEPINIGSCKFVVMGMGRLGTGAYSYLHDKYGDTIVGFDENQQKAAKHKEQGRHVIYADVSDEEVLARLPFGQIEHIMLALSNQKETLAVAKKIQRQGFKGNLAATAKYADEVEKLQSLGVIAFNFYAEAGAGFAEHVHHHIVEKEFTTNNPLASSLIEK